MRLFVATVVASNSCYVKTLLVADQDIDCARIALEEHLKRKPSYKKQLTELPIRTCSCCEAQVLEVAFGENESDRKSDD